MLFPEQAQRGIHQLIMCLCGLICALSKAEQSLLKAALLVSTHQRWQIPDARIGEHLIAQLVD